jgi:hypothetical protein
MDPWWMVVSVYALVLSLWVLRPALVTQTVFWFHEILTSPPVLKLQTLLHELLASLGIPPPYPTAIDIAFVLVGIFFAITLYFLFIRQSRIQLRKKLESDLNSALESVHELEAQLEELRVEEVKEKSGKSEVRIFMEGAFDLVS